MAQRGARFVKHLTERHLDAFQLWLPALPLGIRKCGEQLILCRVGGKNRHRTPRRIWVQVRSGVMWGMHLAVVAATYANMFPTVQRIGSHCQRPPINDASQ